MHTHMLGAENEKTSKMGLIHETQADLCVNCKNILTYIDIQFSATTLNMKMDLGTKTCNVCVS